MMKLLGSEQLHVEEGQVRQMTKNEFYYESADKKTKIHAVEWTPDGAVKAVLQIAHGVTEHMFKYEKMAEYFTSRGVAVVGNDHLGHGLSIAKDGKPMYFGPEGSWDWVEQDMCTCYKTIKKKYPDVPYFILGLSLGSFLVRSFMINQPGAVDGAVLVGTGQTVPAFQLKLARFMARKEAKKSGDSACTPLIHKLTFETYNKQFAPNRTDYDWLCADEEGLNDYIADDLRGESVSAGMFREMLNGMLFTGDAKNQKRMDKNVPILLISGNNDPVGESGKGVKRTYDSLKKAGVENVDMKLYPGLRHDILREKEKMDVFGDIYKWMAV